MLQLEQLENRCLLSMTVVPGELEFAAWVGTTVTSHVDITNDGPGSPEISLLEITDDDDGVFSQSPQVSLPLILSEGEEMKEVTVVTFSPPTVKAFFYFLKFS